MPTISELASSAQERLLNSVGQGQSILLATINAWGETLRDRLPGWPFPWPLGSSSGQLPVLSQVVEAGFSALEGAMLAERALAEAAAKPLDSLVPPYATWPWGEPLKSLLAPWAPLSEQLPSPSEVVAALFSLAERSLDAQREFALGLLAAMEPLMPEPAPPALPDQASGPAPEPDAAVHQAPGVVPEPPSPAGGDAAQGAAANQAERTGGTALSEATEQAGEAEAAGRQAGARAKEGKAPGS